MPDVGFDRSERHGSDRQVELLEDFTKRLKLRGIAYGR
jgi:hypothetical protein